MISGGHESTSKVPRCKLPGVNFKAVLTRISD